MPGQLPKHVVQERFDRLLELQEEVSWAENRRLEGSTVEVLLSPGEGRKDGSTARISGRARDNRLVHISVPPDHPRPRPGDIVDADVTYGAPHHLVADSALTGGTYRVRATAGGAAWERAAGNPVAGRPLVSLGLPQPRGNKGGASVSGASPAAGEQRSGNGGCAPSSVQRQGGH